MAGNVCLMKNVSVFWIKGSGAKIQWIQDPSQSNVDTLDNVRREVRSHFRNKKKA
jgi:rhamnose utilization protein RhaD (predicted bifunctional aldolase and dehydrogenase)